RAGAGLPAAVAELSRESRPRARRLRGGVVVGNEIRRRPRPEAQRHEYGQEDGQLPHRLPPRVSSARHVCGSRRNTLLVLSVNVVLPTSIWYLKVMTSFAKSAPPAHVPQMP